jgi:hypothetical protein
MRRLISVRSSMSRVSSRASRGKPDCAGACLYHERPGAETREKRARQGPLTDGKPARGADSQAPAQ